MSRKLEVAPADSMMSVVLIEDQREVRAGLAALINRSPGFRCMATFRTMEEALEALGSEIPDVVLTDIGLPGMSGVEGIRILRDRFPKLPIVALTVYDDNENIFDALCAGATGYLLKSIPPVRLLEGLKEVASGGAPMSPEIARRVVHLFREFRPPARASHSLTRQEVEF